MPRIEIFLLAKLIGKYVIYLPPIRNILLQINADCFHGYTERNNILPFYLPGIKSMEDINYLNMHIYDTNSNLDLQESNENSINHLTCQLQHCRTDYWACERISTSTILGID